MGAGQEGNPGNQRGQDEGRKVWVGALKGLKEEVRRGRSCQWWIVKGCSSTSHASRTTSREQGERKSRGLKELDWREGLERRKARESAGGTTVRKIAEIITRRVVKRPRVYRISSAHLGLIESQITHTRTHTHKDEIMPSPSIHVVKRVFPH
jgi:hypothetical protein